MAILKPTSKPGVERSKQSQEALGDMELLDISSNLKKISWLIHQSGSKSAIKSLINDTLDKPKNTKLPKKLLRLLKNGEISRKNAAEEYLTCAMRLQHKALASDTS